MKKNNGKISGSVLRITMILLLVASIIPWIFPLVHPIHEAAGQTSASITLTPSTVHQTITGWEGAILHTINDYKPVLSGLDAALNVAVNDIGLTRARLEIASGAENPTDWGGAYVNGTIDEETYLAHAYEIINDNSDSSSIDPAGFHFTLLDYEIDTFIVPLRQKLAARGEQLYINLNYVDFDSSSFEHHANAQEYAEFMLTTFQHMQSKYAFVPNGIEIILEPDLSGGWTAAKIGNVIVATAARLQANGFAVPDFIAPSPTDACNAPGFFDTIMGVSGAGTYLTEISYHRYSSTPSCIQSIASRGLDNNKNTSMLEWWDGANGYQTLHEDLKTGRNSTWQQGIIADAFNAEAAWVHMNGSTASVSPISQFTRQYTRYVRPGARRIGTSSTNSTFDPLAFINADGKYTVVVKATEGGSLSISNLPAGTYGIFYTTNAQYNVNLADATLSSGQNLSTSIPAAGAVTIYGKTGGRGFPPNPPKR
jgi:hypothetical protein